MTSHAATPPEPAAPHPPLRRVLLFFLPPLVFVIGFPLAFASAFHSPVPHGLDLVVSGPAAVVDKVAASLDAGGAIDASATRITATAIYQVRNRKAAGAISIEPAPATPGSSRPALRVTTYVASGGSLATSSVVRATGQQIALGLGTTSQIIDLVPVATADGTGSNLFYLLSYSSLGGYVTITALLSFLPGARLRTRFTAAALAAVGAPLVVFGLMSIFVGAYEASFGAVIATLAVDALYVFTVATIAIVANQVLRSAAMAGVLTFVIFLNFPSTGGGVPAPLLPGFWRGVHEVYFGAGAMESFRSLIYFDGHGATRWILQLASWTVGVVVLATLIDRTRAHRRRQSSPPPSEPASAGEPARSIPKIAVVVGTAVTPVLLMTLLTVSFVSAGHRPRPHDLPLTVAGPASVTAPVVEQLGAGDSFDVTATLTESQARERVQQRKASGAFVLDGSSLTILSAPAAGSSASTAVTQTGQLLAQRLGVTVTTVVVAPLSDADASGTTLFFLLVVCTVGAFLCVVGVAQSGPGVSARRMLTLNGIVAVAVPLIGFAVLSIFAGAMGAGLGGVLALLGVAMIYTLTIGMLATLATQLVGSGGIILVFVFALALNLPSSGGTSAAPMLPGFWQGVHHIWVGAGGYEAMRSIVYFDGNQAGRWLLQLGIWTLVVLAGCTVLAVRQQRAAQTRQLDRQLESAAGLTLV